MASSGSFDRRKDWHLDYPARKTFPYKNLVFFLKIRYFILWLFTLELHFRGIAGARLAY